MEMRPTYRGEVDSSDRMHSSVHHRRSDAPSLEDDSDIIYERAPRKDYFHEREIRDVVKEVRNELLHETSPHSRHRFELMSNEDIMDADTTALWSTSALLDGEDSSTMIDDSVAPMRDFSKDPPTTHQTAPFPKGTMSDAATVETTVMSFRSDSSDDFSSSCFIPGLDEMAQEAKEIFCCGDEMANLSDGSNAMVESAATELLHESILEGVDSFFSDAHARSLQATFTEVSEELDDAGNQVVDLTSMMSMRHLCAKKNAVLDEDEVNSEESIPSEVTFKVKVLSTLNMKKSKQRKRRSTTNAKNVKRKGMFRKLKGRFRKGKSQ